MEKDLGDIIQEATNNRYGLWVDMTNPNYEYIYKKSWYEYIILCIPWLSIVYLKWKTVGMIASHIFEKRKDFLASWRYEDFRAPAIERILNTHRKYYAKNERIFYPKVIPFPWN
jgi:hypothetical protein